MFNIEEKAPSVFILTLPTPADPANELLGTYPELMSVEQVAKALGVSVNSVRTYLKNGVLPGRKVTHKWIIPRQALCKWLSGQDAAADLA
jgi:excisionase family DNA binding protein